MRFGILGPLQVSGDEATVTAGRDRTVLAVLLLHARRVVPVDELVDAVWDDDPPVTARGQLQTCVSRLRRLLTGVGVPAETIVTGPAGYRVDLGPDDLDVQLFERLVAGARAAAAEQRWPVARERYQEALGLWRGPALAGIPGAAVRRGAASLDEQRMLAMEDSFEVELRLGQAGDLVAELTDLVERHPLRERLRGQLMLALADSGRRAEALAVFRTGREILAGELGIDPGAALGEIHRRVLAGDVESTVAEQSTPAPSAAHAPTPVRCLPRAIEDFTGREETVTRLRKEIENAGPDFSPVYVIDGMPGSGKTALAVYLATVLGNRYPDAHLFVDLHGHSLHSPLPPATAVAALLRQLGVPPERLPTDLADRLALWRTELASRRVLLVLDNAASTAQVSQLLPAGPGCLTVVTSRRRLMGLDGVRAQSLAVLEPGEAVDLLARIVGPDRIAAEPQAAAEVIRRCGYLPLAIRLAGARLAHRTRWRVADLAQRLGDAERPVLAEFAVEHRTLADAFALSYAQLPESVQRTFRLLGLHPGERFDQYAVAAVADLSLSVAGEHLDELVDAHLVDEVAGGRFRFHDLVREYAAELVTVVGGEPERRLALRELLDFYLHAAVSISQTMEPTGNLRSAVPGEPARPELVAAALRGGLDWLEAERQNMVVLIRLADEQGLYRYAWQLARANWRQLYLGGHLDELVQTHTDGLRAATALGDDYGIATIHNYLASAYFRLGEFQRAAEALRLAIAMWQRLGDVTGESVATANLGAPLMMLGRTREAVENMEHAVAMARPTAESHTLPSGMINLGNGYLQMGRYPEALRALREQLFMARQWGRFTLVAESLGAIGAVYSRLGRYDQARRWMRLALRLQQGPGNSPYATADLRNELGMVERMRGRPEVAASLHREALAAMRDAGDRAGECAARNRLGLALHELGETLAALELHRQALLGATRIQHLAEQARALDGLARCLSLTDPAAARSYWTRSLALMIQIESPEQHDVRRRLRELDRPDPPAG